MRRLLALALLIVSAPLGAQGAAKVVSPGMSRAQVVAVLGAPATVRTVAEFTYLFYQNSCGRVCGMNDLVVLRGDSVVDAIFRSPSRRYSGTSSSPVPITPREAARAKPSTGRPAASPTPTGRMKPPAEANDARPSIPLDRPTMAPATSTPPPTRAP